MDSATNRGNIFSRSRMLPVKGAGNRPMLLIGLNRADHEARLSKISPGPRHEAYAERRPSRYWATAAMPASPVATRPRHRSGLSALSSFALRIAASCDPARNRS
jgi:hypothetical protein